jgi:uncharacterized protein
MAPHRCYHGAVVDPSPRARVCTERQLTIGLSTEIAMDINRDSQQQNPSTDNPNPASVSPEPTAAPVGLSALGPSAPRERIVAIDVLRGFALLGILLINIRSFAMIDAAFFNPYAAGPITKLDLAAWYLGEVFAYSKFMTIFSMLFGAGILLMYQRREQAGLPAARIHYRRMLGLLLIGLVHAYLIWDGDILVAYALCGGLVYLFRRWRPSRLFALGIVLLLIGTGIYWVWGISLPYAPAAEMRALEQQMLRPPLSAIEQEIRLNRGPWIEQFPHLAEASLLMQTLVFLSYGFWRVTGLMVIGMGLFKLGVLTGRASRRVYIGLLLAAVFVGLPLILLGLWWYPAAARGTLESFTLGSLPNYWGSIPLALGYSAAIMLLCRQGPPRWMQPLAAVGRTALSNYLLQSLICTLLFYGHGLALFGRVSWAGQIVIVVLAWALQLSLSTLYLKRFQVGPVEATWRMLTYWRPCASLRAARSSSAG